MSQNKFVVLSIFMSLLLCKQVDAMKRQREEEVKAMEASLIELRKKPTMHFPKAYLNDHYCNHCDKIITYESIARHAFGTHAELYSPFRPVKKQKTDESIEILNSSSRSLSSSEESSFSDSESSESSLDKETKKFSYVEKFLKNGKSSMHISCAYCNYTHASPEIMDHHNKMHKEMELKKEGVLCNNKDYQVCKICDFIADVARVFQNHLQTHEKKEDRTNTVTCKICDKVLSKKSSLDRHISTKHKEG